jgi:hypothetical protein
MHVNMYVLMYILLEYQFFLGPINKYELAETHDNSRMKGLYEAQGGKVDKKNPESPMLNRSTWSCIF